MTRSFATNATLGICALVLVVFLAGRYTVQAGPLDPPAGPVQPTMQTLEEIGDKVDLLLQTAALDPPWSHWAGEDIHTAGQYQQVISGSGMLHRIIFPTATDGQSIWLRDGNGIFIGRFRSKIWPPQDHQLDISFENGLELRTENVAQVHLQYKPGRARVVLYRFHF